MLQLLYIGVEDVKGDDVFLRQAQPASGSRRWNTTINGMLNIAGFMDKVLQAVIVGALRSRCRNHALHHRGESAAVNVSKPGAREVG